MARARNIKPGFFQNENLVEHPFEVRLLFIGLWTLADKKGRLEDRPKKIKMGVFPADDVNVEKGLALLCADKFIDRYEVNGVKYIQITNWEKHQAPHHTEKDSVIPPLNNGEETVTTQKQDGGNPPDSLIHRFSDSLIPTEQKESTTTTIVTEKTDSSSSSDSDSGRAKILAGRLMKLEIGRGMSCRVSGADPRVVGWAKAGVSDPVFREAYDMALTQRIDEASEQAINPGFLDVFIAKLVNPSDKQSQARPVAWHESATGIEAKGAELGVDPPKPETGGFPAFKARVFAAAGMQAQAA